MGKLTWKTRFRYMVWPKITAPFKVVGEFVSRLFTIQRVAIMFALAGLVILYFTQLKLEDLLPNIVTELFSIAITVFIINALYKRHSDDEAKRVLIQQLGSKNNAVATQALTELEARGWLADGTLQGAYLGSANLDNNTLTGADMKRVNLSFASLKDTSWFETDLEDAFLSYAVLQNATLSMHAVGPHFAEANLKNADMSNANLLGAKVRDAQLIQVKSLWRATMPDGSTYDGRYNLSSDIELFYRAANSVTDVKEWAFFYGVSFESYLNGQLWAKLNSKLFKNRDEQKQ